MKKEKREHKYRAWDKINKKWMFIDLGYPNPKSPNYGIGMEYIPFPNHDFTEWQQYTGLTDKNGKEIYEGDIVNFPEHPLGKREIEWEDCGFNITKYDEETGLEVIGNIYKNQLKNIRVTPINV